MSRSRARSRVEDGWSESGAKTGSGRRRLLARWQLPPPEGRSDPTGPSTALLDPELGDMVAAGLQLLVANRAEAHGTRVGDLGVLFHEKRPALEALQLELAEHLRLRSDDDEATGDLLVVNDLLGRAPRADTASSWIGRPPTRRKRRRS